MIKDQRVKNFLMNVNNVGVMKMFFLCHLHHTVFKINPHKLQILILVSNFVFGSENLQEDQDNLQEDQDNIHES